ncbi:Ribonuclease h domain, partial [Thalictrum thalictroides]
MGMGNTVLESTAEWYAIMRRCRTNSLDADMVKAVVCATVYDLWKERNRRMFKHQQTSATFIANRVLTTMSLFFQKVIKEAPDSMFDRLGIQTTLKNGAPIPCSWQKPPPSHLSLNSDGSVSNEGCGYGGIFRDHLGSVKLAYAGSYKSTSVITQELKAIEVGLKVGTSLTSNVLVGTDSLRAANILNDRENPP